MIVLGLMCGSQPNGVAAVATWMSHLVGFDVGESSKVAAANWVGNTYVLLQ
jgi:hypothetical protein